MEWTQENRPKLNNDKTQISVDGIRVKVADNIKYVGLWLDGSLSIKTSANSMHQGISKDNFN